MNWQFTTDRPIYIQLVEQIQRGILLGEYPLGSGMPSVRVLAIEAEVNPNTMQKALAELESQGLLHTLRTSGRTVTTDEALVTELRQTMAFALVRQYFVGMESIGINREQAIKLLSECENKVAPPAAAPQPVAASQPVAPSQPAAAAPQPAAASQPAAAPQAAAPQAAPPQPAAAPQAAPPQPVAASQAAAPQPTEPITTDEVSK